MTTAFRFTGHTLLTSFTPVIVIALPFRVISPSLAVLSTNYTSVWLI